MLAVAVISKYGGVISYSFFYAVVLIPVMSWGYLIYVYGSFKVHQEVATRNIIAGRAVPYSFILKNEGRSVLAGVAVKLYADFSFVDEIVDHREFRLYPGDRAEFNTHLTCRYRGEYRVGVNKIIISDFLGLFRLQYRVAHNIEALVKPRIIKLDGVAGVPELDAYIQSQAVREKDEADLAVREYIKGDSLKRIHWKATAKTGDLKVRNEIGTLKQKIYLLGDCTRGAAEPGDYLPVENKILEIMLALGYYFARQSIPMEILWPEKELKERRVSGMGSFNFLYEELAAVSFRENGDFGDFFYKIGAEGRLAEGTTVFMAVQRIDADLFAAAAQLTRVGKIVVVYVVTEEDIAEYLRQSSMRLRIIKMPPDAIIDPMLKAMPDEKERTASK